MSSSSSSNFSFDNNCVIIEYKLRENIVEYIKRSSIFRNVEDKAQIFHQINLAHAAIAPFILSVEISYYLLETFPLLLEFLSKEPNHCKFLFKEVLYNLINTFFEKLVPVVKISIEQLHCLFRIQNFPHTEKNIFDIHSNYINNGLTIFDCVINSCSIIQKFTRQAVWFCRNHTEENLYFSGQLWKAPNCFSCHSEMTEYVAFRATSDFCIANVTPLSHITTHQKSRRGITFFLRIRLEDNLCQDLSLGEKYTATGVYDPFEKIYNIWNIKTTNN